MLYVIVVHCCFVLGMNKDEVKLQIEEGRVLHISGEWTKEDKQNNDKPHCMER